MKSIIQNFLHSGYTFTEMERAKKYKVIFLNSVIGFATFIAFIMGLIRLQQKYILMGSIDLIFSFIFIFFLFRLRVSKDKIESIGNAFIFAAYLLFTATYILATNQLTRLELFFLLVASAFFLKGKQIGFYWLLGVIFTIIAVHFTKPTHYSYLDIFTVSIYLVALYLILNVYEAIKDAQTYALQYLNEHLESLVKKRTEELEIANTELKKEKESLKRISSTDQLTGLHNRYKIREIFDFEKAQSKRYKTDLSIIMMDIDHFKDVNDTYGHCIGDQFLKEVADILTGTLRETEMIVRWGGEEFLIIVPKANAEKIKEIAERLRETIEQKEFNDVGHRTASFGITTFIENDSLDSMVHRADNALYVAKEDGRNRVETG
ncbi:MAG: GGDEF domain-containing protein [Sulfurovum sp.]|nr:MAG: GGDEF domain-containing protein [Sulfurovum sp.]